MNVSLRHHLGVKAPRAACRTGKKAISKVSLPVYTLPLLAPSATPPNGAKQLTETDRIC
jgi:hypothetical protein